MAESAAIPSHALTLGILAGGRATRLGGRDKAWLERGGNPQVLRIATRFGVETGAILVSANRELARYAEAGLDVVPDRFADAGPLSGLDALAASCTTPWLFTVPVDVVDGNDCLLRSLATGRAANGACAQDDDGPQPLVALWRVDALRMAAADALAAGDFAVRALQKKLGMAAVRFAGVRFGNLNTPDDLQAAGIGTP
ncbi:MAG TPA: NTP transferase domain-containing protein [Luteimonas sp.]|nr:NTP transferase domain-containing protein [Luteimonas sp.]HRO26455.1 NTP transferase domain-containing protein [Luteimonas sp.]HRP73522.1 NTP transferase domain-containing protein [Luteimonas sp.]